MENQLTSLIEQWLNQLGLSEHTIQIITLFILFALVSLFSYIAYVVARYLLINILNRISKKTKSNWDDILVNRHFFRRLANLIPAAILLGFIPVIFKDYEWWINFLTGLVNIYITVTFLLVIDAFLNAVNDIYQDFEIARTKPIKGYIQIVKIGFYFIGAIIIIAIIIGKSPLGLLTGLGAITAVLLFVFRDPILGFIGGIQLSANDLVRPGDWIVVSKHNADGTVVDINLTSVKVQNWDKTITSIPVYSLVSDSFINWRGMEESGGRRIKRAIHINMESIKFCTEEMIDRFRRIKLISDYITRKEEEIKEYNKKNNIDTSVNVNMRRQTNIGVFRQYLSEYLKNHPQIRQDMTIMVRQLAPTETGLPVEIYCFSKIQSWVEYEMLQSDIFDHIMTVIGEFELSVFQNPSGNDFKSIANLSMIAKTKKD
jgi:miniconductance mechanosensitive channel